jgi:hypothetical protein
MSEIGSESAYPHNEMTGDGDHWQSHAGLTKREHFAALAMQGLLAQNQMTFQVHTADGVLLVPARKAIPSLAVDYADALLAALKE